MKLTKDGWLRIAKLTMFCMVVCGLAMAAHGQAVGTTTVQGTVYLANGQPGSGTLTVSWPAFTTSAGQLVAADQTSITIGSDGFVSINLAPNQGASPAGQYYTAVFYLSDGTVNTQYWIVPAAAQATLAQIQAQVMPAAQAVQAVSKAYVDQAITEATQSLLGGAGGVLTAPLYLSGDPTQPLQAADKHYVDTQVATAVPLTGGSMVGPLTVPAVNGVESPAVNSQQTTLQAAMNAALGNGAMEIPPTYAGTDTFTNPNGNRVTDLRTSVAQQIERSVKEFGAVCDGVTDDTTALQAAINYAQAHGVALTLPQGTCKTQTLNWHGESIGGLGKQVSALMGFPGKDVLATTPDSANILSYTRLHDFTIYVDQSQDVSCSLAEGRAAAGSCQLGRPMESNTIFSPGGNGLNGTVGSGTGWAVGNCAIAMQAATGTGGNGLKNAQIENVEIVATGTDPMAAQYSGAHSTHTCGLYLAQWPQWSEFKNIDIRGLNTGVAIPALPVATPAGLLADSNRWQNITIQATHGFTVAYGCNGSLDNVTATVGNSAATGEAPTGIILDLPSTQEGWTIRNAVVIPNWIALQPALTVTAAIGAVTSVAVGTEHGLGWDPYGTTAPVAFSGSCTAQANATVSTNGSISAINVTQGGSGCSSTTTASVNAPGNWDTAAPVNLIGGQNMTFFAGSLLRGHGGYTVWNATGAQSYGTQVNGGGGSLPGGGSYRAFVANNSVGSTFQVDQFAGTNFGAMLQACVNAVNATTGGICDARDFTGNQAMSANLTISIPNTTILLPCATITTSNQVIVTAGTRNVSLRGCAMRGGSTASGAQGGTAFAYSGTGAVIQVGDPTYAVDTPGFHMDNTVINTNASTSATAKGLTAYRTQELDLEEMYFLGNSNQTGMTLDGTGNYSGGTIRSVQFGGFQIAVNAIGHQVANPAVTDWMNASTFVRLHIDCPTSSGSPIAGTIGINLLQGDGNTFTGGDVENCATALHLGLNAQNNTFIGLRNEGSTSQVVADAGSSYNDWITGGTLFTGQLTDNGTRNSFQDTFHRSFNGINGDWYGSQQDATVTNHFRLGIGAGNERGLLNEYQTDYGYRWTEGLSDATSGEQFYQIQDQLNNVYRLSIGQYNNGQASTNNQTAMNSAGTGAVVLNSTSNAGTGGVIFGSGGASPSTVATVDNSGDAHYNGTLLVGGTSQSTGTLTVRNNADAEVDYYLWPGLTTSQKGSFTYKDWNGNSQWYMVKDSSNNWAVNSALGGLDSFKAYQSTNSGDTYIDASNSSGHIRLNYETGSGAETDIYSGSSSNLVASFLGPTAIKFPGLAASSGHYCLQVDTSGYLTNTGLACGSGSGGSGSGTISSGNLGQIAYYTTNGTVVGGVSSVPVTAGGTGSTTAAGAMTSLGGASLTGANFTGPIRSPNISGIHQVDGVNTWNNTYGSASTITVAYADACINGGTVQIAENYGGSEAIPSSCSSLSIAGPVQPYPQVVDGRLTQTAYKGKLDMLSFGMDGTGATNTTTQFVNAWAAANTISNGAQHAHTLYFPIGQYQINEANLATAGASLLEGESMQGSILNYDGAGGYGSYLFNNQGSNYGGARHMRMNGSNYGGTVTTMAQDFIHLGPNNVDAGVELEDLDFQGAFGNALTFGGGPNFFMRHFRMDAIGGYGWYVNPSTNGGNGDPYHISDGTLSNELPSAGVTNYGIGQGYIQGTGNVGSVTYLSGGTLTGTGNVTLSGFNNSCSSATATMAVNNNAAGAVTVTNGGSGCTVGPTSATCTSGTASCTGSVALTSTLTGGVVGGYTYGTVFSHNNTGFLWNLENIRDEEDIGHINIGNGDEGTFWSDNDTSSSASGPTVTFHNYTVAGSTAAPHPVVSTAAGGTVVTLIGANNFSGVSALYKNRLTQQEYGSPFDGSAALYSFGRQAYSMQGIELEDQRFDVIPHANWTGDNVVREIGDWFFRHQTDFSPGTMGPFDVVVSPTSGRASMETAELVTSVGTILSNPSYVPSYLSSVTGISGITVTGAVGSTVVLTGFNGGLTGAQVLVTLATANSFNGASFTVLNQGNGATSVPTSATCSSGTLIGSIATCSGTATATSTITTQSASTYANLTAATSTFPAYIGAGVGSVKSGDNLLICSSGGSITQSTCTSATAVRVACVNMTTSEQNCAGLTGKGIVIYPAPGCLPSSCAASGSVAANFVQATTSNFGLESNRVATLPAAGNACPYEGDFEWLQNPLAGSVMNVTCSSSLQWVNGPTYGAAAGVTQLTQDVTVSVGSGSRPATVVGIDTVPLCTGFTPAATQTLVYTTTSTPNPCWNAAAAPSLSGISNNVLVKSVSNTPTATSIDEGQTSANTVTVGNTDTGGLAASQFSSTGTTYDSMWLLSYTGTNPTQTPTSSQTIVEEHSQPPASGIRTDAGQWPVPFYMTFSPGALTSVVAAYQYGAAFYLPRQAYLENITGTALSFTCSSNPTFNFDYCGTSAGTCSSPTAEGSITLTGQDTIVAGTVTTNILPVGYYVLKGSSGTCTALNFGISAQMHSGTE